MLAGLVLIGAPRPAAALDLPIRTAAGDWDEFLMDGHRIIDGRKDYYVSIDLRLFFSRLSGFVEFEDKGSFSPFVAVVGDHVDFVDDLGVAPDRNILIPEIAINFWGRQVIRVGYFSLVDSAHNTLTRTFVFGGTQFTTTDDVNSQIDLRVLRVRYEFGIFNFGVAGFGCSIAAGLGGDVVWVRAQVDDTTSGDSLDTGNQVGGVPIVTLRARADLPYGLGVEGHAEGFHLGLGWVGRGSVGVDWQVLRFLSIQAGYAVDYVHINMREMNGIRAALQMQGVYASVTAWF